VSDIDAVLTKTPLFFRILGEPKWKITVDIGYGTKFTAEGKTVVGAWKGIRAMSDLMGDVTIASDCPWNKKGKLVEE